MFQKFLAIIFSVTVSFNSFCMQHSTINGDFQSNVGAANYFIKVLGGSTGVSLSIINDGVSIFDRRFTSTEYAVLTDTTENDIFLCKQNDSMLCQIYSAARGVFFSFLFNFNGDIELSSGGSRETGVAQNTMFAFQTNKSVKNYNPIAFHHLAISCYDFYNYSVLQMNSYLLFAKYYYNAGVIDSTRRCACFPLRLGAYIDIGFITQKPEPTHKVGTFDNFGALLGRDVHALGDLNINSTGSLNVENLFAQNGSIAVSQRFDISGALSGKINSFRVAPQTFAHVGSMQTSPMKSLINQGNLHISKTSKLDVESLENEGEITGAQSLEVIVDTIRNSKGVILAKDAMDLIKRSKEGIRQQIRAGEEAKIEFCNILGRTVKVQHHTDHYLNTITNQYTRDQFGRETFSHRTETGYVFQRRETRTEEKELPAEALEQIAKAMEAKNKQLEFLRLSLKLLDKIEEALKAQVDTLVESDSADDVVVDIHALRAALKSHDPASLDRLLLTPRVYEALSSHNMALRSVLAFLNGGEDIEKLFSEVRTAPVVSSHKLERKPSFSDLAHVSNVEGKASGLSFESIASHLTLWRYDMERLAAANSGAYQALMTAWDARVQATIAVGVFDALVAAPATSGGSLVGYGLSLGVGLGLDYLADVVAKHGAEKAAALASGGDPRLYESYHKTFNYVGAMVAQHGVRAGLRSATSFGKHTQNASREPSLRQSRDYSTSFNTALKQRTFLAFEEAGVLTRDGRLTQKAIQNAKVIPLASGKIDNPIVEGILIRDKSNILDWEKYKTRSVTLPNGESRQIHFYMNKKTGRVDHETADFKVSSDVSLGSGLK